MNIEVQVEHSETKRFDPDVVRRAAREALDASSLTGFPALTVRLTGDQAIRDLNRDFMGADAPTDVLSFPSGDPAGGDEEETYLGDIIISLDQAGRQALEGGHTLVQEVELLTVHGVLHLLGHDHADAAGKQEMWAVQSAILQRLSNPLTPP